MVIGGPESPLPSGRLVSGSEVDASGAGARVDRQEETSEEHDEKRPRHARGHRFSPQTSTHRTLSPFALLCTLGEAICELLDPVVTKKSESRHAATPPRKQGRSYWRPLILLPWRL
jgi:hypothetical protein